MKLQCKKCGKKKAELISKMDIKTSNFTTLDTAIINKILEMADNLFSPNYIVCKSCGHVEKS